MFVNQEEIKLGIAKYVDNEIASKATGFNKFMVYFAMPIINKKVESFVKSFSDNEMTSDFFNENKQVDIDKVYNMAKDAIKKSGQFLYYGIMFNESDVDKLYASIRSVGGNIWRFLKI